MLRPSLIDKAMGTVSVMKDSPSYSEFRYRMTGGCACRLSGQLGWVSQGDSCGTGQNGCHGIGQDVSHGSGQDSCHSTGNGFTAPFFPACFWTVLLPVETLQPCSLRGYKIADLDLPHSSSGLLQWPSLFPSFVLFPPLTYIPGFIPPLLFYHQW